MTRRASSPTTAHEPDAAERARRCGTTPARLRGRLAGDLDRIVLVALRKEPGRRYDSANALALDLERHLTGRPIAAREESKVYVLSKFIRRNRLVVAASLAVAMALTWGLVTARRGERLAAAEADHARGEAQSFHTIADFLMADFLSAEELVDPLRRRAAEEKIARQAERVRRQFEGEAHERANLLDALGRVCMQLQLYDAADPLLREAHEARRAEFGDETLEVALSLASRGELEYRRGDFQAALEHLQAALDLQRSCPVGTHTDVATAANNLAVALRNTGASAEAAAVHEEALALRRAAEPDSLPVAESLNNLGGIHLDRSEHELAHTALAEALTIRERILGPVHELTLQSVSNLAIATWRVGQHERARALFEQSEQRLRELQSLGYPGLVVVLGGLAALDLIEGRLDAAQARLEEALALQTTLLGSEHPSLATHLVKLAKVHAANGRLDDALALWEEALELRRTSLDPAHPKLAKTLREHAFTLLQAGELDGALAAAEEAVGILVEAPPHLDAELGRAELTLGMCLRAAGESAAALRSCESALEHLQNVAGVVPHELELVRAQLDALAGED